MVASVKEREGSGFDYKRATTGGIFVVMEILNFMTVSRSLLGL